MVSLKPLHYLAMKYLENTEPDDVIRNRNINKEFALELKTRKNRNNLINIQIRGEQTSGKSLAGFIIMDMVNSLYGVKTTMKHIAHDQMDFVVMMKDLSRGNECILIDEWNEMSTTGYNSTTNQALLTNINEVQAQRFANKVSCSPLKSVDPTARIILEVIEKDIKRKETTCLVRYVIYQSNIRIEQLVGHIIVPVGLGLKNKTYIAYRKRKFEKMKMMMESGIYDARQIEEAKVVIDVIEIMKKDTLEEGTLDRDEILGNIEMAKDKVIATSILGEDKLIRDIRGILIHLKNAYKKSVKKERLIAIMKKCKDGMVYNDLLKRIDKIDERMKENMNNFSKHLKRYQDILDKAKKFEEMTEKKVKRGEKERKGGKLK